MRPVLIACALAIATGCGAGPRSTPSPPIAAPAAPTFDELVARARGNAASGDVEGAHAGYQAALATRHDTEILAEDLALLTRAQRQGDAIATARAFTDAVPGDAEGIRLLAEALIAGGKPQEALPLADALVARAVAPAASLDLRGRARTLSGQVEDGLADLRQAIALAPDQVAFQTSLGLALERARNIDEAGEVLLAVVKVAPANAVALRELGMIRRAQFENAEARDWLLKATAAAPDDAEAWIDLAIAQNELGENADAEQSAARATTLAPARKLYWYVYGEFLRINKKPEQAIAAYDRASAGPDRHPRAVGKHAMVLLDSSRAEDALALLRQATTDDPDNSYLHYVLGWTLSAQREHAAAITAFERYLALAPRDDGDRNKARDEIRSLRKRLAPAARLLEQAIAAHGDLALTQLRSLVTREQWTAGPKATAIAVERTMAPPDRLRVERTGDGDAGADVLAGSTGWRTVRGVSTELPAEERTILAGVLAAELPRVLVRHRAAETLLELLPPERLGKVKCDVVRMTSPGAPSMTLLLEQTSHQLRQVRHDAGDGRGEVRDTYDDFRTVAKVAVPFRRVTQSGDQTTTVTVMQVTIDGDLAARFDPPSPAPASGGR